MSQPLLSNVKEETQIPVYNTQSIPNKNVYQETSNNNVTSNPVQFTCEAIESHSNIVAIDKCSNCNKMLCLKCKNVHSYGFNSSYYRSEASNGMAGNCVYCADCFEIAKKVGDEFSKFMIVFIISIVFGVGLFLFPILVVGFIYSRWYLKNKLPSESEGGSYEVIYSRYRKFINGMSIGYLAGTVFSFIMIFIIITPIILS